MNLPDDVKVELDSIRSLAMQVVGRIDKLIPPPAPQVDIVSLSVRKAIVAWLERHPGQTFGPVAICRGLRAAGRNDKEMTVQVSTNELWHEDKIERPVVGHYRAKQVA